MSDIRSPDDTNAGKPCVACGEALQANAKLCRHCHTPQQRNWWKLSADFLKWVGGIAAVISLIMGVAQLNNLFQHWQERQEAVAELVKAASLQSTSGDHEGAWNLIEKALTVDPSSRLIRRQQVDLAMEWLRNVPIRVWDNKDKDSKRACIERLLPVLYRGAAGSDQEITADAFAHIGWANHLGYYAGMNRLDVESHFRHAIELDEFNPYAHAMLGYWWLDTNRESEDPSRVIQEAMEHFSMALKSARNNDYVRYLQIIALARGSYWQGEVEAIRLADEIRKNREDLDVRLRCKIITIYRCLTYSEDESEILARLSANLLAAIPPTDLLDTYLWLIQGVDFDDPSDRPLYVGDRTSELIIARLLEESGDLPQARERYEALLLELEDDSSLLEKTERAVERVSRKEADLAAEGSVTSQPE